MKFSKYERAFGCVQSAEISCAKYVDEVVEVLRKATAPMSCAEIGEQVFGKKEYHRAELCKSYSAKIGTVLTRLVNGGYVDTDERKGIPHSFTVQEEYWVDANDEPEYIAITDCFGRKYKVENPYFKGYKRVKMQPVTKLVYKNIRTYIWIG